MVFDIIMRAGRHTHRYAELQDWSKTVIAMGEEYIFRRSRWSYKADDCNNINIDVDRLQLLRRLCTYYSLRKPVGCATWLPPVNCCIAAAARSGFTSLLLLVFAAPRPTFVSGKIVIARSIQSEKNSRWLYREGFCANYCRSSQPTDTIFKK